MSKQSQKPASELNQRLNLRISIAVISSTLLLSGLLFFLLRPATVQSGCTGCTTTISGVSNATLNPSSGHVICITSSGDFQGTIRRNSNSGNGTVIICNEGKITNATLEFNKGENIIDNYGTMSPSTFAFNSGSSSNTITNHAGATASFSSFNLYKNQTVFENYGQFSAGSFILSSGAAFNNYASGSASTQNVEINNNSTLLNEGTFTSTGNWKINSNGAATNHGLLSLSGNFENNGNFISAGELSIGGNLQMNSGSTTAFSGDVTVSGNVEANETLSQSGLMHIGGNLTVNSSGRLTISGIVNVAKDLTNNGHMDGPPTASGNYGRVNVSEISTQNSSGRMQYNLDVCDAGNPSGGLDVNYGNKHNTVTHCVNSPVGSLPVEWGSVEAVSISGGVQLSWTTLQEVNNDHFTVERSTDAQVFQSIAEVAGAGTTSQPTHYQTVDARPNPGRAYYRIRQTDFDGQTAFSPMVEVRWQAPGFEVSFSPNPVSSQGVLRILSDEQTTASYRFIDLQGREALRREADLLVGENLFDIQTEGWAPGVYVVDVRKKGGNSAPKTLKIIKQ